MSGENYDKKSNVENWGSFDHVKPIDSFDLEKKEEQEKCNHWTNIQPVWHIKMEKKVVKLMIILFKNKLKRLKSFKK